ncbi:MAG: hypothetical protein KAY08_00885 [Giesbergeria sp.]|nr:hypothetical protein [Giesbergeria sp.]
MRADSRGFLPALRAKSPLFFSICRRSHSVQQRAADLHWALGTAFLPALPVHPTGLQHQSSFWLAGWLAACNAVGGLKLATSFQFMAKSAFRAYADCASSSLFNSKNRSLLQADCKPVKAKPL